MQRPYRALAIAAAFLTFAACDSGSGSSARSSPTGARAAAWPGAVSTVQVGAGPVGLTTAPGGGVWVAEAQASQVSLLASDKVQRTTPSVDLPLRVAASDDDVWSTAFGAGQLVRIAAGNGRITARVQIGRGAEGVTSGLGAVWVVAQDDGRLVKVDPTTAKVAGEAAIDVGARLVTTGLGAVWVSQFKTGRVLKVDPTTLAVTASADLCRGPQGILATADAVWVTCTTDNVALRLDPAGLTVEKKVRLPEAPDGIAAGPAGGIFVVCQAGPTVVELDPSSGAVKRQRVLGGAAQLYDQANVDIAATADTVWVSSFSENLVYRLPT